MISTNAKKLSISFPEDLWKRAELRFCALRYRNLSAYLQFLVEEDLRLQPDHLRRAEPINFAKVLEAQAAVELMNFEDQARKEAALLYPYPQEIADAVAAAKAREVLEASKGTRPKASGGKNAKPPSDGEPMASPSEVHGSVASGAEKALVEKPKV